MSMEHKQLGVEWVGSISSGTMHPDHLAQTFTSVLREIDPNNVFVREYDRVNDAIRTLRGVHIEPDTDGTMEWLDELVSDLFDELDQFAPEGTYFGAHPGDGADYGYWPVEDTEDTES